MTISEKKKKLLAEEKPDLASLIDLVEVLRSPEGCPWDREQDHHSIRTDFIEETYEVVEAIDREDAGLLCEELGDVLLQIAFHTQIEREKGVFTMDEVIAGIVKKMISRHPHVFGDVSVADSAEVLENWDKLKTAEKSRLTLRSTLEAVPRQYPALLRARKIAKKAEKAGADLGTDGDKIRRIRALADSLGETCGDPAETEKTLTELVWTAVQLAGPDADLEKDLGFTLDRFIEQCPAEPEKPDGADCPGVPTGPNKKGEDK